MNNQKTYSEKLRDPRWQKKRLEVMQRDEFTCQLCTDTKSTLHVHHKEYQNGKEPWEYDLENFVTYCEACHLMVEDIKPHEILAVHKMRGKTGVTTYMFSVIMYFKSLMVGIYEYDETEKILSCKSAILDHHVSILAALIEQANSKIKKAQT